MTPMEDTIAFVERLRDAATMCLADDLADMAHYMRDGDHPERTEAFAEAIEVHDRAVRAVELELFAAKLASAGTTVGDAYQWAMDRLVMLRMESQR